MNLNFAELILIYSRWEEKNIDMLSKLKYIYIERDKHEQVVNETRKITEQAQKSKEKT